MIKRECVSYDMRISFAMRTGAQDTRTKTPATTSVCRTAEEKNLTLVVLGVVDLHDLLANIRLQGLQNKDEHNDTFS